jgi:hypothetical protein
LGMNWMKIGRRLLLAVLLCGFPACNTTGDADGDNSSEEHPSDSDSSRENETETVPQDTDEPATDTIDGTDTETESEPGTDSTAVYENQGMCGVSGEAEVTTTSFVGFEEHYLIEEEDSSADRCRVRYALHSVGTPAVPCDACVWSFIVEKTTPQVITDLEGACAKSTLGLDDNAIASMDGERIAYGYVEEYVGHSNVLMRLNDTAQAWEAVTFAFWDETTTILYYDRQDGYCGY